MPSGNGIKISSLDRMLRNSKATTSPVSIRIKDSTLAVLNVYAAKYDMKVGTVINQILDSYADAYNEMISKKYDKINQEMHEYLTGIAKEINSITDENLVVKLQAELKDIKTVSYSLSTDPEWVIKELEDISKTNPDEQDPAELPFVEVGLKNIYPSGEFTCEDTYATTFVNGSQVDLNGIFVDAKKWLVVVYMFFKYYEKRKLQLKRSYLGADALMSCANFIGDNTDRTKLIYGLAERFTDFVEPDEKDYDDYLKEVIAD